MRNDWEFGLRRPEPLWRADGGAADPALIVLRRVGTDAPTAAGPAMPEDARHRALLRAGFRSHAENQLMAGLGRLADGESASSGIVAQAIEDARQTFGAVGEETERETRGSLDRMMAGVHAAAARRTEALRGQRALEALAAEAADLAAQVERDPDNHGSYLAMLDAGVERFADGMGEEEAGRFAAEAAADFDAARVRGLLGQGRLEEAEAVLGGAEDGLPDDVAAALRHDLDAARRETELALVAERALLLGSLQADIAAGGDVSAEIAAASAEGRLLPPHQRLLQRAQEEHAQRAALQRAAYGRVEEALSDALRLDAANVEDRWAVELFWRERMVPALDALEPGKRLGIENGAVATLGIVPRDILTRAAEALAMGHPEAAVVAARQVVSIIMQRPETMDQFPAAMIAVADRIWQAHEAGAAPAMAAAFGRQRPDDAAAVSPSLSVPVATAAGTKPAVWAVTGMPKLTSDVKLGFGQRLSTVMQPPGGPIDRQIDRLAVHPDGGDAAATMYLRRINAIDERLNPLNLDETGTREIGRQHDEAIAWFGALLDLLWPGGSGTPAVSPPPDAPAR